MSTAESTAPQTKPAEAMSRYERYSLFLSFISVLIIGLIGLVISFFGYRVSKMNSSPYFEIAPFTDAVTKETGYIITNEGGYIQNANIQLNSIIHVQVKDYSGKDLYYSFQEMTQNCRNPKDGQIVILFQSGDFGVHTWGMEDRSFSQELCEKLSEHGINAAVYYMEYLTIQFMDSNRTVYEERYLIGEADDGALFLSLIPEDVQAIIDSEVDTQVHMYRYDPPDGTVRQIGNAGHGGAGRRFTTYSDYADYIAEDALEFVSAFRSDSGA